MRRKSFVAIKINKLYYADYKLSKTVISIKKI